MCMHRSLTRRGFTFGLGAVCSVASQWKQAIAAAKANTSAALPPIAPVMPKTFEEFGTVRVDDYDWLRDPSDPRVTTYLYAENAYTDKLLEPIKPLVDELVAELKERARPEDVSVPTGYNGYFYERQFVQGSRYPLIARRKDFAATSGEEVVLDVSALAAGQPRQYQLGSWAISPNNKHVAFTVDFNGDRQFRVFVRTPSTGEIVE